MSDATEALLQDPQSVKALFRRATALEKLQLFGRAQEDLRRLLEIEPTNKEASAMLERMQGKVTVTHGLTSMMF
jgi:cytochrome c-type biogenesis protein CcmH/NrfG